MRLALPLVVLVLAACGRTETAPPTAEPPTDRTPPVGMTGSGTGEARDVPKASGPAPSASVPDTRDASVPEAALARVLAFIRDFEEWALAHPPSGADSAFADARADLAVIGARHWTAAAGLVDDAFTLSSPPAHVAADEHVIASRRAAPDRVIVETRTNAFVTPRYYEYVLVEQAGAWRIDALRTYLSAADEEDERPILEAPRRESPPDAFWRDLDRYLPALLSADALPGEAPVPLTRAAVGRLHLTGRLAVHDPGWFNFGVAPLPRRLAPGDYDVVAVLARGRVAALTLVVAKDARPVRYVATGVLGVDTGLGAIFDADAVAAVRPRQRERMYEDLVASERDHGLLPLGHRDALAFSQSGDGDGGYPILWALGADDAPIALVVDYLVAGTFEESPVDVVVSATGPLPPLDDPRLARGAAPPTLTRDGADLVVTTLEASLQLSISALDARSHADLSLSRSIQVGPPTTHRLHGVFDGRDAVVLRLTPPGTYGSPVARAPR